MNFNVGTLITEDSKVRLACKIVEKYQSKLKDRMIKELKLPEESALKEVMATVCTRFNMIFQCQEPMAKMMKLIYNSTSTQVQLNPF